MTHPQQPIAILSSGGVDSSLLIHRALLEGYEVYPLYIHFGFIWEGAELFTLKKILGTLEHRALRNLQTLSLPYRDWFPNHWGYDPKQIPAAQAPDSAVYIPGRNLYLITWAAAHAQKNALKEIWLGSLQPNSFRDGHLPYFGLCNEILFKSFPNAPRVKAPYTGKDKAEILKENPDFPYDKTLTCLNPRRTEHCRQCLKCAERVKYFKKAGLDVFELK